MKKIVLETWYKIVKAVSIQGHTIVRLFFSRSSINSDLVQDSSASLIMKKMSDTSAYPLTAVNTAVLNEKQSFPADFFTIISLL